MDGRTTVRYLQEYIKAKDYNPESIPDYFMKLAEEVGELSKAILKNAVRHDGASVKDTIDEEIWDVMYYALALANCYGINVEDVIKDKEELNRIKYSSKIVFETDR